MVWSGHGEKKRFGEIDDQQLRLCVISHATPPRHWQIYYEFACVVSTCLENDLPVGRNGLIGVDVRCLLGMIEISLEGQHRFFLWVNHVHRGLKGKGEG